MELTGPGPILLVEDTSALSTLYQAVLRKAGLKVDAVGDVASARIALKKTDYRIILLDMMLPDGSGLEVLQDVQESRSNAKALVITANGSINLAVEAMRSGAFDFLVKPFDDRRLLSAVQSAIDALDESEEVAEGEADAAVPAPEYTGASPVIEEPAKGFAGFIGSSQAMRDVYSMIGNVGRSSATVFLTGESGTGKELAAQAVHAESARRDGPFVPINCGAIPADLLESEVFGHLRGSFTGAISDKKGAAAAADGGTLFLDEICEMHLALQTKLLRFLQTSTIQPVGATMAHKVDVRIICATNRDPMADVRAGRFREDLYYRLHVVPIVLPPLRARDGDVIEIAERLLAAYSKEDRRSFRRLAPEAAEAIRDYRWPGNVRELQNVLRNITVLYDGPEVTLDMLPVEVRRPGEARVTAQDGPSAVPGHGEGTGGNELRPFVGMTLAAMEEAFIAETIASCGGSIPKASRLLGVSPSTLYRKRETGQG